MCVFIFFFYSACQHASAFCAAASAAYYVLWQVVGSMLCVCVCEYLSDTHTHTERERLR